ncbi:MAG: pilus assembly protein PilM [Candidatus Poribacteria bacterium]|nr:pilus assembly protein PilM [Candidatus Poribacteria bacterium]
MAKNQVVAIDIGSAAAKIVHIEKIAGALHLINAGVISFTDPDNPQHTSEDVRKLWNQLGIKRTFFNKHKIEVGIAIPRGFVSTKRLPNLPPATTDAQLPTIVEMAAETELPFQAEESVFTYHDVQRTPESLSVELVSTRRDTVTRYMGFLNETGVTPSAVIPSMLAIATIARNALSNSTARTVIVDIGAERSDFCLMQGDTLEFSRGFSVSGNQLTRTLMTETELDAETAEQEKQHIPAHKAPTRTWTRRFIGELERSIIAAEREINDDEPEAIAEIWLCGGGARVPELAETCQEQLQIPTRLWNPLDAGTLDTSNAPTQILETYGDALAVPLGVGLHLLEVEEPVSLLPTEVSVKRVESTRKHQQLITAGIAGFVLLVLVLCGVTWSRSQKSKETLLDNQIVTFGNLQVNANKQLALELILADKLTHQISPMDILHALSSLFKDRTKVAWKTFEVNNLDDLEKTRISFSLQANSHDSINSMDGVLNSSKLFSNVEIGEVTATGDERRPTFEVKINCRLSREATQMFAQTRYPKPVFETKMIEEEEVDLPPPSINIENLEGISIENLKDMSIENLKDMSKEENEKSKQKN